MTDIPHIELYSDWWANPNPGPGGYGIILKSRGIIKEFSQGYMQTTNNRMELTGVITGLSKLKRRAKVDVYTDSQYTINGIKKGWAQKWKANNWMRTKSEKAINFDLWSILLDLVEKHDVTFHWVKWHSGHIENERCDELATLAMQKDDLIEDENYIPEEKSKQQGQKFLLDNHPNKKEIQDFLTKSSAWSKVEGEWDPCKKCGTPVIKKIPKHTKKTLQKQYYYEYYLNCPNCKTNYMLESAKRDISCLKL